MLRGLFVSLDLRQMKRPAATARDLVTAEGDAWSDSIRNNHGIGNLRAPSESTPSSPLPLPPDSGGSKTTTEQVSNRKQMTEFKKDLRRLAKAVIPSSLYQRLSAVRSRRWQLRLLKDTGQLDRVNQHIEESGTVVRSGPFAGMVYPLEVATTRWSVPKLLGSYESELHPFLEKVGKRRYDCVIDIGSAEGYYASGLAGMLRVPVYAYDPEPLEKAFSVKMSERNGVSHLVTMSDLFVVDDMRRFAGTRALVLCDCEGFEEVLFRPDTLELTRNWDLIIELHGAADKILPLLNWPHRTSIVEACKKTGSCDEYRVLPQRFLLCDSTVSV